MSTIIVNKATEWNFPRFDEIPEPSAPIQFCLRDPLDKGIRTGCYDGTAFRANDGQSWPTQAVFAWRTAA